MSNYSRNENWMKKESWLDQFVSNPRTARDLNSIYADDVITAYKDNEFPTLEAAISDLKERMGLGETDVTEIRKVASYRINPDLGKAIDEIPNLKRAEMSELIKTYTTECEGCKNAPCTCGQTLDISIKAAVEEIGIEKIAEMYDKMEKTAAADFAKIKKIKEELGCSQAEAMKEYWKREKGGEEKKDEPKAEEKKEDKEEEMDKAASVKKNAEKWVEFFKQAWFQGSDEKTEEGNITSNNPEALGYPKEVGYDRKPLETQVGGDSRNWEQNWFEGAAKATKPDLGPAGKELKTKEELQRAKWEEFFTKRAGGKDAPGTQSHHSFDCMSAPYDDQIKRRGITKEQWESMSAEEKIEYKKQTGKPAGMK